MSSFHCYDNSNVIVTSLYDKFILIINYNTAVVV